jgi:hypothetical protein
MRDDAELVATTSNCVRANDNLVLTRVGHPLQRINVSSLMFRSESVLSRIGFTDEVRRGADAEFLARLTLAFPNGYRPLSGLGLAVVRTGRESLSGRDSRPGWHHQSRFAYRASFEYWHRRIAEGAPPYLALHESERPFPAPRRVVYDAQPRDEYDVVFVGDWRSLASQQQSMLEEIRALTGQGLKLGVAHLEDFRFMVRRRRPPLCEPIRALIDRGVVDWVQLDDNLGIDLMVLRDPSILQFPPAGASTWEVRAMWSGATAPG